MGFRVVQHVGASRNRIDLGVLHGSEPGRFILGIECEGAMYHAAKTARDRDRLRREVLESLGWRIHRVWSRDWVLRRKTDVLRLREAVANAQAASDSGKKITENDNEAQQNGELGQPPRVSVSPAILT